MNEETTEEDNEVDETAGESAESCLEALRERQRKEKRDLQSKVTEMRRSIPKGDRKRKKDIIAEIERLEAQMRERHRRELAEVSLNGDGATNGGVVAEHFEENAKDTREAPSEPRVSKAQRRREKKAIVNQQRTDAEYEDICNAPFAPGKLEWDAIARCLAERNLAVFEIPADGDCLYNAVAHQSSLLTAGTSTGAEMRRKAAVFIRSHKEDFMPFLTRDDGDPIDEFEFDEYCGRVERPCERGGSWGGEPELRALSGALERRIVVVQPEGRVVVFGEQFACGTPLTITFHRFAFRLGEHYNSTVSLAGNVAV